MKIDRQGAGGKGHKIEDLPCMSAMTTITGGGEIQRRVSRDYSKKAHAEHDTAGKDLFPDVSTSWSLGGVRTGNI
jgi:hypothetical protein